MKKKPQRINWKKAAEQFSKDYEVEAEANVKVYKENRDLKFQNKQFKERLLESDKHIEDLLDKQEKSEKENYQKETTIDLLNQECHRLNERNKMLENQVNKLINKL